MEKVAILLSGIKELRVKLKDLKKGVHSGRAIRP